MSSYYIPFASRLGQQYELRIYSTGEGYNADGATQLTGAPKPFVTEEDNTEDILLPVRGSTGNINIVTDDPTLQKRITPTTADGMRVTLVCTHSPIAEEGTLPIVMWEGYLQPTAFTQDWAAGPWEIQLPVISRLAMVAEQYLSSSNSGIVTVGQWLQRLCGNVYDKVYIASTPLLENGTVRYDTSDIETPTALQVAFSENKFKERVELADRSASDGQTWKPGTNRDIASSISPVFRWTVREIGDALLVDDPGIEDLVYNVYNASDLSAENPKPYTTYRTYAYEFADFVSENCSNAEGSIDIIRPWGAVEVIGNNAKIDQSLLMAADEDWQKVAGIPYVNGAPGSWNRPDTFNFRGDSSATIKTQKVLNNAEMESYHYLAQAAAINGVYYGTGTRLQDTGKNELASCLYGNVKSDVVLGVSPGQKIGGGEVCNYHVYYGTDSGGYTHLRQNSVILSKLTLQAPYNYPGVKFRTTLAQLFCNSQRIKGYPSLLISGRMTIGKNYNDVAADETCENDNVVYGFKVSVKIGDYYIGKDSWGNKSVWWSSGETVWDVLLTKPDKGEIREYVRIPITGYVPLSVDAPVEVTLYAPTDDKNTWGFANYGYSYIRIDNFSLSASLHEAPDVWNFDETLVPSPVTNIRWRKKLGSSQLEEHSVETRFSGIDGTNPLMCGNYVNIGTTEASPKHMRYLQARKVGTLDGDCDGARYLCRRTCEWLATQGRTTRAIYNVSVRTQPQILLRTYRWHLSGAGVLVPLSNTINWRDDDVTMKIIENNYGKRN